MKIVVVSDSHKEFHKLNSVVENNLDADAFIHLGDGEHEETVTLPTTKR